MQLSRTINELNVLLLFLPLLSEQPPTLAELETEAEAGIEQLTTTQLKISTKTTLIRRGQQ